VKVQQHRNRYMKLLMERAGLTREFVRVRYVQGEATEEVVPLWQVVTTHTARHTGADMLMLGSGGDSNLKEKALGHAGVYGHDALERYGPALLKAWRTVLGATELNAPKSAPRQRQERRKYTGGGMSFGVVKRR
jgi:integrase